MKQFVFVLLTVLFAMSCKKSNEISPHYSYTNYDSVQSPINTVNGSNLMIDSTSLGWSFSFVSGANKLQFYSPTLNGLSYPSFNGVNVDIAIIEVTTHVNVYNNFGIKRYMYTGSFTITYYNNSKVKGTFINIGSKLL